MSFDELRGRRAAIVWFTKGLGCPFCRVQMSRLAREAVRLRGLGAEIFEITPTPLDRARMYARRFTLPFPYLCDPDHRAHRAWGLAARTHSTRYFLRGRPANPTQLDLFGAIPLTPGELLATIRDDDAGFFVIDAGGTIRYARAGSYYKTGYTIPTEAEIRAVLSGAR